MMVILVYNSLPEVLDALRQHELATNTRYCVCTKTSNFGREELSRVERNAIRFKDKANVTVGDLEFTGIPFMSFGYKRFKCQFGYRTVKEASKVKARPSKKVDCPAKLQIRAVCHFPSYKMNSLPSEREYRRIKEAIFQTIQTGSHLEYYFRYYMELPSDDDHKGHPINEELTPQMIDPRISVKIKELYHQGVHTTADMRLHINAYIHEICGGPPDPCNARFRVDSRTLRNHIYIAKPKPLNPPPKPPKDLPDDVIAGASIDTYLNFHGFGKYVGIFHDHQIYDALQLVHVTNEDMMRMKVKKDHRRVILTRIKWLRNKFLQSDQAAAISLQEQGTRLGLEHNIQATVLAGDQIQKKIRAGSQAKKNVRAGKQVKKNIGNGNQMNENLDSRQQLQEIVQTGQQNSENVYMEDDDVCDVGIFDDDTMEEIILEANTGQQVMKSGGTDSISKRNLNWDVTSLNSGLESVPVKVVAADLYSGVPIVSTDRRNLNTVAKNLNGVSECKTDGTHLNCVKTSPKKHGPKPYDSMPNHGGTLTDYNTDVTNAIHAMTSESFDKGKTFVVKNSPKKGGSKPNVTKSNHGKGNTDLNTNLTVSINGISNEVMDEGQSFGVAELPENNTTTSMFTENVIIQDSKQHPGFREVTKYTFKHSVTVTLVKVETVMRKSASKNKQKRQRTR